MPRPTIAKRGSLSALPALIFGLSATDVYRLPHRLAAMLVIWSFLWQHIDELMGRIGLAGTDAAPSFTPQPHHPRPSLAG